MTILYNKSSELANRRELRKNMIWCEKIVWNYLRKRRFSGYKFRRQYSVGKYILDFYSTELRLALEIDGDVHEVPEQKEKDKTKDKVLEGYNIHVLRIKNDEIEGNPDMAFERLESKIKEIRET